MRMATKHEYLKLHNMQQDASRYSRYETIASIGKPLHKLVTCIYYLNTVAIILIICFWQNKFGLVTSLILNTIKINVSTNVSGSPRAALTCI